MIPISCGPLAEARRRADTPGDKTLVSSSRFVLPFGYLPMPAPTPAGAGAAESQRCWFEPSVEDAEDPGRRSYATPETAEVLFERAGWFELVGDREELYPTFPVHRHGWGDGGSFEARIEAVKLALFEWSHELERAPKKGSGIEKDRQGGETEDLLATGFLILDVSFVDDQGPVYLDDLLAFNELFRYFRLPFAGHDKERHYSRIFADLPIDPRDPAARLGALRGDGAEPEEGWGALYRRRWEVLLEMPVKDAEGGWWRLFPQGGEKDWREAARQWLDEGRSDHGSGWAVYADSRAFVSTAAMIHDALGGLRRAFPETGEEATSFGHWIKLLNVDAPGSTFAASHASTPFEREWADEKTYRRWQAYGTVYGFTYHSSALLGPRRLFLATDVHWRTNYFDQTLLLFYLRVTSFRFSRSLSQASGESRLGREIPTWQKAFEDLRHSFATFTNLYEFPLISNQQQGLELYALAREAMDVEALFREVRQEILGTHEFFESVMAKRGNKIVESLTVAALLLGVGALITGFFGMNVLIEPLREYLGAKDQTLCRDTALVLVGAGLSGLLGLALVWRLVWRNQADRA